MTKFAWLGGIAAAAAFALLSTTAVQAASISLAGNYLNVGVNDAGTLGSGGSTSPGMLHDPSGTSSFGVNDYLTPGTPHEGYGIKSVETGWENNENYCNCGSFTGGSPTILGSGYLGKSIAGQWSGTDSFGNTIQHTYFFNPGDQRVNIETVITAGPAGLTALMFARSLDPDPDVNTFGSYATTNSRGNGTDAFDDFVGAQGPSTGLSVALLNLNGSTYAHNTYIDTSCCSNVDPATVLAGGGPIFGATNFADYSINMAWLIGDLSGGHSATINYAYLFGDRLVTGGVPEPATLALFGVGLAGLGALRRRKAKA